MVPVYVLSVLLIRIRRVRIKTGSGRKKVEIQELWGLKMDPWRAVDASSTVESRRIKMERVPRPVVADSHHFDEKQDQDPHQSERRDPDTQHCFLRY
jgi:hypothetical protein